MLAAGLLHRLGAKKLHVAVRGHLDIRLLERQLGWDLLATTGGLTGWHCTSAFVCGIRSDYLLGRDVCSLNFDLLGSISWPTYPRTMLAILYPLRIYRPKPPILRVHVLSTSLIAEFIGRAAVVLIVFQSLHFQFLRGVLAKSELIAVACDFRLINLGLRSYLWDGLAMTEVAEAPTALSHSHFPCLALADFYSDTVLETWLVLRETINYTLDITGKLLIIKHGGTRIDTCSCIKELVACLLEGARAHRLCAIHSRLFLGTHSPWSQETRWCTRETLEVITYLIIICLYRCALLILFLSSLSFHKEERIHRFRSTMLDWDVLKCFLEELHWAFPHWICLSLTRPCWTFEWLVVSQWFAESWSKVLLTLTQHGMWCLTHLIEVDRHHIEVIYLLLEVSGCLLLSSLVLNCGHDQHLFFWFLNDILEWLICGYGC